MDAGGKGLCYILQGWLDYLEGRVSEQAELVVDSRRIPETRVDSDLEYVYCTEFIVTGDNLSEEVFRNHLAPLGDSLLVAGASGLIKVHIHTNNPGSVLEFALSQGKELQDIKIDNMRFQHNEVMSAPAEEEVQEPSQNGVIAVAAGSGLAEIFKSMGADYVVMGGQTMNPSTEDFLQAIDKVRARQIIILPNNGNVIMAAQQAAEVASPARCRRAFQNYSPGLCCTAQLLSGRARPGEGCRRYGSRDERRQDGAGYFCRQDLSLKTSPLPKAIFWALPTAKLSR